LGSLRSGHDKELHVSLIEYSLDDHIAVIQLNRPERLNAMSPEMGEELIEAFRRFNADDDAWVGILTGSGRAFCAGRDMKAQASQFPANGGKAIGRVYTSERNMFGLSDTTKPLIAAVNGFAIGMGWYMMIACDIRLAAAGAQFAMTEVPTGVLGPYWMAGVELLPWPVAAEFALLGERVSAERLERHGVLNAVVPPDELMAEAQRWAGKFVQLPPRHVQATKALMLATRRVPDADLAARERETRNVLAELADSREAVLAWVEKRPAVFRGV
jgi:E-phenylitaconyl-CoA hydratase